MCIVHVEAFEMLLDVFLISEGESSNPKFSLPYFYKIFMSALTNNMKTTASRNVYIAYAISNQIFIEQTLLHMFLVRP